MAEYEGGTPGFDPSYATSRIEAMRFQAIDRDRRMADVLAMRRGDYNAVARDILPEDFDRALVSNLIDTAAHDLSEVMAPLPAISCASSSITSQTKKDFANKRALIANHYVQASRLSDRMYAAADKYVSFGWFAYKVQPDIKDKMPVIHVSRSSTAYFTCDLRDRVVQYAELVRLPASELCHIYPDHAPSFRSYVSGRQGEDIEVAEWHDDKVVAVYVPDMKLILNVAPNVLKRPAVRVVGRPSLDGEKRGQFDDVIGVQVARAVIAQYTMSAVQQSVEAPIALPDDVQELDLGPYSAIQSKFPEKIGRVQLGVPQGLFPEQQMLQAEQRVGSRYPEARSGNIDASIVTGQGVQALMGTFDTQIQAFQHLNESALEDVMAMCLEMDQKLWPNEEKSIRVKDSGSPVEIKYTPSKDIADDYACDVSYGAVAGLDPNRSLIFLLQAVSGGMLSRETARRFLPVELDDLAESKRMDLESIRDAELAAVAALSQAIPQMAASGQDPREVVLQISQVIKLIESGKTVDEAVAATFAPKEQASPPAPNPDEAALLAAQGAAGEQATDVAPPSSPGSDLLMQLAGISPSGQPNLQANVSRMGLAR